MTPEDVGFAEEERRYEIARREREERDEIAKAVEALSRIANRSLSVKVFIEEMAGQHRTLQQAMTGMMLAWFKHLSALPESHYDLRNEASVKIAKKVMAAVDGVTRLPLI